jgi:PAS domain S-box-containing protein
MSSPLGRAEHVVIAMQAGRDRELLAEWLDSRPGYAVETVDADEGPPEEYDICLLDVPTFRAWRANIEARVADANPVYLPHILLVRPRETVDSPSDRLPGGGSVADSVINELLTLPVKKAVLHRRVENLLGTRRASVQLAEREEQYQRLVELTPEGILLVADGDIAYANAAAESLLGGASSSSLDGEPLQRFVPPESQDPMLQLLDCVGGAAEGEATEFTELPLRNVDGETFHVSVAGVPVTDEGDRVVQLLMRDISEEKRRKQQLQLFGRAVDAANNGIVICDARQPDMPITYANEGFQRITGYPLGEILGRNCRFLQGPRTNEEPREQMRAAIDAEEPTSVDILNYRKDGTTFWNRVDLTPIRGDEGVLTHYLGFQRDITERIRRKQRLAVLNRILRHNVRNKTNVIHGYAEGICEGEQSPEVAAAKIQTATSELLTISEQIREFDTVLEEGTDSTEEIDIGRIVAEGVAALERHSPDAEVSFDGPASLKISAHHTIEPAIENLFSVLGRTGNPACKVRIREAAQTIRLDIVDRSDALDPAELELVESGIESSLQHLQRLELWLLKWTVEQSGGEFDVGTRGDPGVHLTFLEVNSAEE